MGPQVHVVVLVADPDEDSCAAVSALTASLGLVTEVVGTGAEALAAAHRQPPAVVLLDVELDDPSAYEVCRELREKFGQGLPVVFMSATRTEPRDEIAGLLLGADDYFVKPLDSDRFVSRLRRLVARSPSREVESTLTAREVQVLALLVAGLRPVEISQRLCITKKTASTHIEHILAKLGAHSQAQAVAFAIRDGVLGAARDG
jgi:DNA-binding NarL/FixJ family response regulator